MRETIDNGTTLPVEFRAVWPDGSIRHLLGDGRVLADSQGKPTALIGVDWDVTPLRDLNTRLSEQHELLRVVDRQRRDHHRRRNTSHLMNPAAERTTGWLSARDGAGAR